jgi:PAS domain S-box-containing protein
MDENLTEWAALAALRPVLETALDAVVTMGRDGHVLAWNAAAELTFGWSSREARGQPLADLIIAADPRLCAGRSRGTTFRR